MTKRSRFRRFAESRRIEQFSAPPSTVRSCRVCGCTDKDCSRCIERTGLACHWIDADLCSACKEFAQVAQPVERHVEGVCVEGSTPSLGTKCVDCKGRGYRKLFRHGKMRCLECEGTGIRPAGPQTQEDLDELEMDANNVPEFGE